MNWIDLLVVLVLIGYLVAGISRGFLLGILDLAGMVLSLVIALVAYRPVAELALQLFTQVPRAVAILGAFLVLVLVVQVLYSMLVSALSRLFRSVVPVMGVMYLFDRSLGVFPGIVKGVIFASLALLPFAFYPLVPQATAAIERSALGSKLVAIAIEASPAIESRIGQDLNEGLTFLTPPQTDEGMKINFGMLGELTPDPAAEAEMLRLVNWERQKAGLKPLEIDERMREVARQHSMEMFKLGYFAHNSPVTGTPFDRIRKASIPFVIAGENLAYAPNVQIAHEGLMNSPGHRANILRPEFGRVGIGVIKSEFRGRMFSQEFMN